MKLDRVLRKIIPSVARLSYNPIFKFFVDSVDVLPRHVYNEFSKIPPNHMRIRVGVANRLFTNHVFHLNEAKDFWFYALHSGLCRLDSHLVDIGCGCGRFAQHLRDYRFKQEEFCGRYVGIDIDDEMLEWCRRNFDSDRFEFHRSSHASRAYNVTGEGNVDYVLPVGDESVDFVFSTSLFTHLLERELVNYCRESYRVLKADRCMAMYCFSMNHPPPTLGDRHTFAFKIGNAHVESITVPEAAVAYEEEFLFKVAREAGFLNTQMLVGTDDWQPMLLCRK